MIQKPISIFFNNCNSDRRCDDESGILPQNKATIEAYKDIFSFTARLQASCEQVDTLRKQRNVSCFAFQELNSGAEEVFRKKLQDRGLQTITHAYNPGPMAFRLLFAYDAELVEVVGEPKVRYLTESGNTDAGPNKQENLGTDFCRSIQFIELKDKKSGQKFGVANVHFGIENEHKELAAKKAVQLAEEVFKEKIPVIFGGDFNAFDATSPAETKIFQKQITPFTNAGYDWNTSHFDKEEPKSTFIAFPFDIHRFFIGDKDFFNALNEVKALNSPEALRNFYLDKANERGAKYSEGALDHVFTKNTEGLKVDCNRVLSTPEKLFIGEDLPSSEEIEKRTLEAYKNNELYHNTSDHLGVLVEISK